MQNFSLFDDTNQDFDSFHNRLSSFSDPDHPRPWDKFAIATSQEMKQNQEIGKNSSSSQRIPENVPQTQNTNKSLQQVNQDHYMRDSMMEDQTQAKQFCENPEVTTQFPQRNKDSSDSSRKSCQQLFKISKVNQYLIDPKTNQARTKPLTHDDEATIRVLTPKEQERIEYEKMNRKFITQSLSAQKLETKKKRGRKSKNIQQIENSLPNPMSQIHPSKLSIEGHYQQGQRELDELLRTKAKKPSIAKVFQPKFLSQQSHSSSVSDRNALQFNQPQKSQHKEPQRISQDDDIQILKDNQDELTLKQLGIQPLGLPLSTKPIPKKSLIDDNLKNGGNLCKKRNQPPIPTNQLETLSLNKDQACTQRQKVAPENTSQVAQSTQSSTKPVLLQKAQVIVFQTSRTSQNQEVETIQPQKISNNVPQNLLQGLQNSQLQSAQQQMNKNFNENLYQQQKQSLVSNKYQSIENQINSGFAFSYRNPNYRDNHDISNAKQNPLEQVSPNKLKKKLLDIPSVNFSLSQPNVKKEMKQIIQNQDSLEEGELPEYNDQVFQNQVSKLKNTQINASIEHPMNESPNISKVLEQLNLSDRKNQAFQVTQTAQINKEQQFQVANLALQDDLMQRESNYQDNEDLTLNNEDSQSFELQINNFEDGPNDFSLRESRHSAHSLKGIEHQKQAQKKKFLNGLTQADSSRNKPAKIATSCGQGFDKLTNDRFSPITFEVPQYLSRFQHFGNQRMETLKNTQEYHQRQNDMKACLFFKKQAEILISTHVRHKRGDFTNKLLQLLKVLQMPINSMKSQNLINWIVDHSQRKESCKIKLYQNHNYELFMKIWINEKGKHCFDLIPTLRHQVDAFSFEEDCDQNDFQI
eukprot:403349725